MKQQNFWDSLTKTATEFGETLEKTASETAAKAGEVINNTVEQATQTVKEIADGENVATHQTFDLATISESDRMAFYGALFAIATADGSFDKEEMELIFGIMDLEGMSETAKRQVQSYVLEAPPLLDCLRTLSHADEPLRFALMVNLIDTALADEILDPNEERAIKLAQQELRITDKQVEAIETFVRKIKEVRDRGLDDNYAADAVKNAASGLTAVGVPIAAVYFSGSVIGLSAAGITSGLAALGALVGLGGMVPGIGVAVLLGAGIFMGVSTLLDTGDKRKKEQLKAEKERKAQLVIKNLQNSLNAVIERIENLQQAAADAESNREAIRILTEKMRKLQQIVAKRKRQQATS